jgi:hypothetical protein
VLLFCNTLRKVYFISSEILFAHLLYTAKFLITYQKNYLEHCFLFQDIIIMLERFCYRYQILSEKVKCISLCFLDHSIESLTSGFTDNPPPPDSQPVIERKFSK